MKSHLAVEAAGPHVCNISQTPSVDMLWLEPQNDSIFATAFGAETATIRWSCREGQSPSHPFARRQVPMAQWLHLSFSGPRRLQPFGVLFLGNAHEEGPSGDIRLNGY